ncbi:hypothetical protein GMLC_39630 [Geomonas limicola]|uniref:Nucleotidyltransferase n=1 Tax=Geomonas limicola TaxID=2740186 RepID=A0A6V8NEZ7_9BACT|nr:nucleotidyltransferase [Geomonas limicola]GFO70384.1 hypothetical protein GMLC_39630 [Geomonas limicola]
MRTTAGVTRASEIFTDLVPPEQWAVYAGFMAEAVKSDIPFAVGGGLAISAYTGCARNTKDLDLFILEKDSQHAIQITKALGLEEYLEVPYDPTWSYRSSRGGYILDFLWRMLNGRSSVTPHWLSAGWELEVRGVRFRLLPVEELIWSKLYIVRRDRSDWPDLLSLLYRHGPELDWEHLLADLEADTLVLGGVVNLFRWLCPGVANRFPELVWARLGLTPPEPDERPIDRNRVALFKAEQLFCEDQP